MKDLYNIKANMQSIVVLEGDNDSLSEFLEMLDVETLDEMCGRFQEIQNRINLEKVKRRVSSGG